MARRSGSRITRAEEREESRMLMAARRVPEFTNDEWATLKQRCREATPGPWDASGPQVTSKATDELTIDLERWPGWEWDAEFIACAREDIPRLIAEVERLRELLEER